MVDGWVSGDADRLVFRLERHASIMTVGGISWAPSSTRSLVGTNTLFAIKWWSWFAGSLFGAFTRCASTLVGTGVPAANGMLSPGGETARISGSSFSGLSRSISDDESAGSSSDVASKRRPSSTASGWRSSVYWSTGMESEFAVALLLRRALFSICRGNVNPVFER